MHNQLDAVSFKEGLNMSASVKSNGQDNTRIGEYAAKQPLSGIHVVTKTPVKDMISSVFVRLAETKKAV